MMRQLKKMAALLWFAGMLAAFCLLCGMGTARAADAPGNAGCVTWIAEAEFVGVAYNHLVHLHSRCERPAMCRIKTDVNPKEERVLLAPGEKKTHLTFRGSPAREFKANVVCTLQ